MLKLLDIGAVLYAYLRRPTVVACAGFFAIGAAIATNALFLQSGTHPAPLFATRASTQRPTETGDALVRDIQQALASGGLYDGPIDGLVGPQTEAAIRAFEQSAGLPTTGEASAGLLASIRAGPATPNNTPAASDPLVVSVQNALALAAYGPLATDGVVGPDTRAAIMRFQRDHNLAVTGEISDGLIVELRATGAMRDM